MSLENAMEEAQNAAVHREMEDKMDRNAPIYDFDNYRVHDPDNTVDVFGETGSYECRPERFLSPGKMRNAEYESLISKLSREEYEYVTHVAAHWE
jgi:hypothetical protein